ncbi:MAG: nuclear transport factor 2 family protein [Candidatus Heimdallarchaeota archaeon]
MTKENQEEIDAIKKAINHYIDGTCNQDYEEIFKGWHPDGKMMAFNEDGSLKIYDRSIWKDWYENAKPNSEITRTSEILSIVYHGVSGNVKVKTVLDTPKETTIWTDYLNVLKIKGQWFIVNKIFDTIKKAK